MHTSHRRPIGVFILIAILTLLASACAVDDPALETTAPADDTAAMDDDMAMDDDHADDGDEHADFGFGEPADPSTADRIIEISASDAFSFDPAEIEVNAGETITLRVTNIGAIPHDFTLGDEAMQDEHEAEMAEMGGQMEMHDEPNVFSIEPGETKEMTWHFADAAELIFGCHQPGHYAAGMKGTLTVGG